MPGLLVFRKSFLHLILDIASFGSNYCEQLRVLSRSLSNTRCSPFCPQSILPDEFVPDNLYPKGFGYKFSGTNSPGTN